MSRIAYLYCDSRSLNDATNYYVGLIRDCLKEKRYSFKIAHNISDIKNPSVIMTITGRYFFVAKLRFPFTKTIFWAQGVSAEETLMTARKGLKSKLRYIVRRISEYTAVNFSTILFCVSDAMVKYYQRTYGYKSKNGLVVMPCYNLHLSDYFNEEQFSKPTFVYAGGDSIWQGVDFMLEVYKKVEESLSDSQLIICTRDSETFERKIKELGIARYEIKYVPVQDLQNELHKYKYGFIIRDKHIVNEVATPTKMNSYLANYLVPVYSEAVQDFKDNLNLGEFSLCARLPLNTEDIANQIIAFENSASDFGKWRDVVKGVFVKHYNDEKYKRKIFEYIDSCL